MSGGMGDDGAPQRVKLALFRGDRINVLTLNGAMDLDSLDLVEIGLEAAVDGRGGTYAIDFKRVAAIDAAGCLAIMRAAAQAEDHGARMILLNVSADVARVLSENGVDQHLDVYGTGQDDDGPPPVVLTRD